MWKNIRMAPYLPSHTWISRTQIDGVVQVVLYLWDGFLPPRCPVDPSDPSRRPPAAPAAPPPLAAPCYRLVRRSWSSATAPSSSSPHPTFPPQKLADSPVNNVCGFSSLKDLARQLLTVKVNSDAAWKWMSKCNTAPLVRQSTARTWTSLCEAMLHLENGGGVYTSVKDQWKFSTTASYRSYFTLFLLTRPSQMDLYPISLPNSPSSLTQCMTMTITLARARWRYV